MIRTFKLAGLRRYFERSNLKGLRNDIVKRIQIRLNALHRAKELRDIESDRRKKERLPPTHPGELLREEIMPAASLTLSKPWQRGSACLVERSTRSLARSDP